MTDQHTGGAPDAEGQGHQSRGTRSGGRGTGSGASTEGVQSGGTQGGSGGGGQSAQHGSDQERHRQVSREPSSSMSAGTQRGASRQTGSGGSLARRGGQPSVLPAFMANPGLMASAFMSNPFAFAEAMSQEMDRLFDTYGSTGRGARELQSGSGRGQQGGQQMGLQGGRGLASWAPPMEVQQRGNEILVRAELPGLKPDDVQIDVEDGVLTISGERHQSRDDREEGYYHTERSYGTFARSIALPENVDEEQIRARFEHGVLEVTVPIPEHQRQRGRRVQIQSGTGASGEQHTGASGSQSAAHASGASSSTQQQQGNQQSGSVGQPARST